MHTLKKDLSSLDVLSVAFGAMIGFGWVVASGTLVQTAGIIGTIIGFVLGGLMIYFVGLVYAELTTAFPRAGGEMVFSHMAFGPTASYVCTWILVLSYVGIVCFESCSFPLVLGYVWPGILKGRMYSVAGSDVYLSGVAIAVATATFMIILNIVGTKKAAVFQSACNFLILAVGVALLAGSVYSGNIDNVSSQAFQGVGGGRWENVVKVAMMTPFFFVGFDVIPQTAEEINFPLKKLGWMLILSIVISVIFYAFVVFSIGLVFSAGELQESMSKTGLVTADVMGKAFGCDMMAKVLILGGLCGIVTSWNSFLIGGSRCVYSMARANMLPGRFSKLHGKYKTPAMAIVLIGFFSLVAPFFGKTMLTWLIDAASFACCAAYFIVVISFFVIRRRYPDVERPFKISHHWIVGMLAGVLSGMMISLYVIPGTKCALLWQEWVIVGGWIFLGGIFLSVSKHYYGNRFASGFDV